MKANRLACVFLLLFAAAVQLPAQQPVASSGTNATTTNKLRLPTFVPENVTPTDTVTNGQDHKPLETNVDYAPNDTIAAIKLRAEKGDADAQLLLGVFYHTGSRVAKNETEAVKWYRKAAEQGDADAQYYLARSYASGEGVAKDKVEAVKWYCKAAEQNNAWAQFNLGGCYDNGKGVAKDEIEAANWYRKAAEQGLAEAQFCLGVSYAYGEGVETNALEAEKWYLKAAEQGVNRAEFALGVMYASGQGIPQDYSEALKWYRKAAYQGDPDSQNNLGMMYAGGQGVPQDYVEAYKWYNLAAAHGDTNAINNRDEIASHMTHSQIAEAQRLSREFKPRQESSSDNSNSPDNPTATGTGFFITDDGYLISNYHVVKDAAKVRFLTGAGLIDAKVVKVDAANDLALLKAVGKFTPLPVAASRGVKLGGTVATVGFPNIGMQGFSPKLAKGEIASLSGAADDARYFQISVPVQPGNSGGALVGEHGNVIGIVSAKLDASAALAATGALPENVNYAVKSSFLLSFLESVPAVSAKLKEPNTADRKFEDVVKSAQDAAVLVLVY